MGFCTKITIILIAILFGLAFRKYNEITKPLKAPEIDEKFYWGPGDATKFKPDTSVRPFNISYSNEIIEELQEQLRNPPQFHAPLENVGFEYGFNSNELKRIIKYWADDYLNKWDERQNYLNKYPQFKTNIQGLDIHFIHVKKSTKDANPTVPILLLHGWPGSVVEFYEVIEKLSSSKDKEFGFDIVVPSLPGYGWSQGSSKKGLGAVEMAAIFKNLMLRLGYKQFFIQGGDWGSFIGSSMATLYPGNVLGYHSNTCATMSPLATIKTIIINIYPKLFVEEKYIEWMYPLTNWFKELIQETGYLHLQASKPDTIGIVLTGNPIGLAAYILEKFSTWTNTNYRSEKDGGFGKSSSTDLLLDNIMVYYLSNSIATSVRLYSEGLNIREMSMNMGRVPISVPTGCARFKFDIIHQIDWQLKETYVNLVHSTYYIDGGHFSAFQLPEVFYNDLMVFINKIRNVERE